MSLLEKNIDAIDDCIIGFKDRCKKLMDVDTTKVEVVQGKENIPIVRVEIESGKKVLLNSLYRCNEEISHWIENIETATEQVYLVFGLSNGEHIRRLLHKMNPESRIIVYEDNIEIFYKVIKEIDIADIFDNLNKRKKKEVE